MTVKPYNQPGNESLQKQMELTVTEFLRNSAAVCEKAVVISATATTVVVQPLTQLKDTAGKLMMQPTVEVPIANVGGGGGAVKITLIPGDIGMLFVPIRNDGAWDFTGNPVVPRDRKLFPMTAAVFFPLAGAGEANWMVEAGMEGITVTAIKIALNSTLPMDITTPTLTVNGNLVVTGLVKAVSGEFATIAFGAMAAPPGGQTIAINSPVRFSSAATFAATVTFQATVTAVTFTLNGINVGSHGHTSSAAGTRTGGGMIA